MKMETTHLPTVHETVLPDPDCTLFVDGSRFADEQGRYHTGFAVTTVDPVFKQSPLPPSMSAQEAELKALTVACQMFEGKRVNIYTDSRYALGVAHDFGLIWKTRGFLTATGTPVKHGTAIKELMDALLLPEEVAILKVKAHGRQNSEETCGNHKAEQATKYAACESREVDRRVSGEEIPIFPMQTLPTDLKFLKEQQAAVSPEEKESWKQKGATLQDGVYTSNLKFCLPKSMYPPVVQWAHGAAHLSKTLMKSLITKYFEAPGITTLIKTYCSRRSRSCYNMNYFVYFSLLLGLIKAQQVAITKDNHVYTFWYNSSSTRVATFAFDYCDVVNCTFPSSLSPTVYKDKPNIKDPYICVTDDYWGYECSSWKAAGWNTGPAWGYRPQSALDKLDKNGESLLKRMTFRKPGGATPIKLALNIEHPSPGDAGQYVMGMYWKGGGSYSKQGTFYLRDMYDSPEWVDAAHMTINPLKPHIKTLRHMIAIANPTYEDTMAVETGFFDTNLWLEWMRYNANKHNRSNCYVCGGARPHLGTVPLNIPPEIEMCFLSLYIAIKTDRTECESWTKEYPIILKDVKPDRGITIYPGNYTCYGIYDGVGQFFGNFTGKYCATYSPIPAALIQQHVRSLGDIYWICGDMQIRTRLEGVWWGECALAKNPELTVSHSNPRASMSVKAKRERRKYKKKTCKVNNEMENERRECVLSMRPRTATPIVKHVQHASPNENSDSSSDEGGATPQITLRPRGPESLQGDSLATINDIQQFFQEFQVLWKFDLQAIQTNVIKFQTAVSDLQAMSDMMLQKQATLSDHTAVITLQLEGLQKQVSVLDSKQRLVNILNRGIPETDNNVGSKLVKGFRNVDTGACSGSWKWRTHLNAGAYQEIYLPSVAKMESTIRLSLKKNKPVAEPSPLGEFFARSLSLKIATGLALASTSSAQHATSPRLRPESWREPFQNLPTKADITDIMERALQQLSSEITDLCQDLKQINATVLILEEGAPLNQEAVNALNQHVQHQEYHIYSLQQQVEELDNCSRKPNIRVRGIHQDISADELQPLVQGIFDTIMKREPKNPVELGKTVSRDVICTLHYPNERDAILQAYQNMNPLKLGMLQYRFSQICPERPYKLGELCTLSQLS
ncbi:LOW QUALITY PROTEIN: uncharacterized protein RCH25_043714 [Pelodytes ibericus]